MSDEAEWRPPLHSLFVLSQCWNNQNNGVHELEFQCVKRGSPGQDPSHEASLPPRSVRSDLHCDADCPEVCGSTTSAARPVTECSRRTSDQGAHVPDGPIQVPQVEVIVEIVQVLPGATLGRSGTDSQKMHKTVGVTHLQYFGMTGGRLVEMQCHVPHLTHTVKVMNAHDLNEWREALSRHNDQCQRLKSRRQVSEHRRVQKISVSSMTR